MSGIHISHCVCLRTSFASLIEQARRAGWSLGTLIHETGCGAQCGLCRPYLRRMLQTGETVFVELLHEEAG